MMLRAAGTAVAAWALLLGLMVCLGLLITGPLASWLSPDERQFSQALEDDRTSVLTRLAEVGGTGGDTITVLFMALGVAALAWVLTRSIRPALFLSIGLVGQALLYLLAGKLVSRDRPPVELLDHGLDPSHSFPSGHVCTAVMFWGGCAVLLWVYADRRWRIVSGLLVVLPLVVAAARLYQGAHYLSDVATSLIIVPLWVAALSLIVLRPPARGRPESDRPTPRTAAVQG